MANDEQPRQKVIRIVRKGEIEHGQQLDELKVKMVRHIKGRREVGVVVVVVKSLSLRVITVEWEDLR
jgi:hypothetical protein